LSKGHPGADLPRNEPGGTVHLCTAFATCTP
jgi:hypothetical protein